jgi:hypothetical protein
MRTRLFATAFLLGASMLASCTPPAPEAPTGGFADVTSSNGAVSSTDDGCTQSFLMDNFQIAQTADVAADALTQTWTASLTAPAHVAGSQTSMDVRGALLGDTGATGQLTVSFAGASQTFELTEPGNFTHNFAAPALDGANALEVTATIPAGSTAAGLQVDSVDLIVNGAFCSGAD